MSLRYKNIAKKKKKNNTQTFNKNVKILNKHIQFKEEKTIKLLKKIIATALIFIVFVYTLTYTNSSYANLEDNEEINCNLNLDIKTDMYRNDEKYQSD